jgi:hypothetical protein
MQTLLIPLRDPDLRRRLLAAARRDERSPAQQVLYILRRALPPADGVMARGGERPAGHKQKGG